MASKRRNKNIVGAQLVLTALGIVYGDIGTSPLYAFRECFHLAHGIFPNVENILGIISLIFWSLMIVVTLKYLEFILRADNQGEGGVLALTALACLHKGKRHIIGRRIFLGLGLFGAALLVGDGMITPAISVMSAVEGLKIATPQFENWVLPLTFIILILLFYFQKHGTKTIGTFFGPIMLVWFLCLGAMGIHSVIESPEILAAINPIFAFQFFKHNGFAAFVTLGSVFLVVTGGEALYADMGHLGRKAIERGWMFIALPALALNYFGQGALLLRDANAVENPFYLLAPSWALVPLVILATLATVIASQAMITGLFSYASQCIQLGYLPRLTIVHTSEDEIGQVYVPQINWLTLVGTLWLVFEFKSSSAMAAAYGISVSSTMAITTLLACVVAYEHWRWSLSKVVFIGFFFLIFDLSFASANALKIWDGGWVPLLIAICVYSLMTSWKMGRKVLYDRLRKRSYPFSALVADLEAHPPARVPGTAIFMVGDSDLTPPTLLHNLKHNKVLHENVIFLTVIGREISFIEKDKRIEIIKLANGIYRVIGQYGFMESPNVMDLLDLVQKNPNGFEIKEPTFFLGREILVPGGGKELSLWRKMLFTFMSRNSTSANSYFRLPLDRVIEVGMQVEL